MNTTDVTETHRTRRALDPRAKARASAVMADLRWAAVAARDPSADGSFFYSVRTTGVFCKPSCAARPAKPENLDFHATAADATAAGFRPCKRCEPGQPSRSARRAERVADLCRIIREAETEPSLEALARHAGWSTFHLHRTFKEVTGLTPKAFAAAHRAERMRSSLERGGSVTEAIYEAGYSSSGRFYDDTEGVLGMTPTAYRQGGKETEIRFAVAECSLGSILVAASGKGVCAILIGDDPEVLVRDLQDRFRNAELIGADEAFEEVVAKVVGFVEAPGIGLDLPLDVRGTAFQQRVWKALRTIPAGETVTYSELAARIGSPSSARAVARACASNALAVAIPCHRVVRSDGGLSGYRWGVERKRTLLDREAGK